MESILWFLTPFIFWIFLFNFFIVYSLNFSIKSYSLENNFIFASNLSQLSLYTGISLGNWQHFSQIWLFNNSMVWSSFHNITQISLLFLYSIFIWLINMDGIKKRNLLPEIFIFVSFFLFGVLLLLHASEWVFFFISFEIQAFSLISLANIKKSSIISSEASIKYFVLSALFSGLILLSLSLIYGSYGTLSFVDLSALSLLNDWSLSLSLALLVFGLLFKVGVYPFSQWVPDVYEAVTNVVTALFSSFPKFCLMLFLTCLLQNRFFVSFEKLNDTLACLGLFSIFYGSLLAFGQIKIKRILGYSSISQIGYLVVILSSPSFDASFSFNAFLLIYTANIIVLWANLLTQNKENLVFVTDFIGFNKKNTSFNIGVTILFLSLAGVPPTLGFLGKLMVLVEMTNQHLTVLVFFVALVSAFSMVYYLNYIFMSRFKNVPNYSYNKVFFSVRKSLKVPFLFLAFNGFSIFVVTFAFVNSDFILIFITKCALFMVR